MQAAQRAVAGRPLALKVGVHYGPCIAVSQNGVLDYFGSTVNLAARVQRFSDGGDLVISEAMRADREVAEFLQKQNANLNVEPFDAPIKGFDGESFQLIRVTPR